MFVVLSASIEECHRLSIRLPEIREKEKIDVKSRNTNTSVQVMNTGFYA